MDEVRLQNDGATEEKRRLIAAIEKKYLSPKSKGDVKSDHKLFLLETSGPKYTDTMVFTVMAENHVWAEHMVLQWLNSNGRELDKIDKGYEIISRDVRAIISIGSKPLDT